MTYGITHPTEVRIPPLPQAEAVGPPHSSVRLFVHPDRSCYHDIWWTDNAISMKLTGNIH